MEGDPWGRILLLILLLFGAAFCASAEISYASLDVYRAETLAEKGSKRARKALYIYENFDKALITILIGNNITHIAFASVATALASSIWGLAAVPIMTLVSTIIVFFFSEMLPKSYANGSFDFALSIAPSLYLLMKIFMPLNLVFSYIAGLITRLFAKEKSPDYTEEEFLSIIRSVNEEQSFDEQKKQLLNSAIAFDNLLVRDCYQTLEQVDSIKISDDLSDIFERVKVSPYSRLPVCNEDGSNIVGVLRAKTFLRKYIKEEEIKLENLISPVMRVNFNTPIDKLFQQMSSRRNHLCIVVDDEQRIRGIITLEDILEELVGDIWDENDPKYEMQASQLGSNLGGTRD